MWRGRRQAFDELAGGVRQLLRRFDLAAATAVLRALRRGAERGSGGRVEPGRRAARSAQAARRFNRLLKEAQSAAHAVLPGARLDVPPLPSEAGAAAGGTLSLRLDGVGG